MEAENSFASNLPAGARSSLLEIDEAEADDGKEHEGDHEAHEDGDDLPSEMPFVVKIDLQVSLQRVRLACGQ